MRLPDPDAKSEICRRIAAGESLVAVCRIEGLPSRALVYEWLATDENFRSIYAAARLVQADALTDEILEISDDARNDWIERQRQDGSTETVLDQEHVQRSRLRVDSRKWLASKLAPKKYGDASLIKHADADGNRLEQMSADEVAARLATMFSDIMQRGEKK